MAQADSDNSRLKDANEPDAELIALGRQLDILRQRHAAAVATCAPLWEESGRRLEEWKRLHAGYTHIALGEVMRKINDDVGLGSIERAKQHPDDIMSESDSVSRAIIAIPAITIAGLRVKARLAAFAAPNYWDENDKDADWDHLAVRKLIDAVIGVAAATVEWRS
jgi:hypothetical protein